MADGTTHEGGTTERYGKIADMDRSFDIAYWQQQGPEAIFAAAWNMVVEAYQLKNEPIDARLRRDIERFGKLPR
ncbi:MAG: hypothetical protein GC168_10385 [Candidatus Hydrogenedens sp.]|nr:hypothetical protein [Candidatus Hydrogenedens sp.]